MPERHKAQNNVHTLLPFRACVVLGCLLPKNLNGLANRGVAKFNVRNDDAVELPANQRGSNYVSSGTSCWSAHHAIFSDRLLPCAFDLPKLASPRLVVRFLTVEIFGVVDSFLAATGRCVVRINTQNLIVAFHR